MLIGFGVTKSERPKTVALLESSLRTAELLHQGLKARMIA
jgi:hypothetical protein